MRGCWGGVGGSGAGKGEGRTRVGSGWMSLRQSLGLSVCESVCAHCICRLDFCASVSVSVSVGVVCACAYARARAPLCARTWLRGFACAAATASCGCGMCNGARGQKRSRSGDHTSRRSRPSPPWSAQQAGPVLPHINPPTHALS